MLNFPKFSRFPNWGTDWIKNKACRYLLHHYLGHFLKQKLTLDQLSIDLYNGTGEILELDLDVQVRYDLINESSKQAIVLVLKCYYKVVLQYTVERSSLSRNAQIHCLQVNKLGHLKCCSWPSDLTSRPNHALMPTFSCRTLFHLKYNCDMVPVLVFCP